MLIFTFENTSAAGPVRSVNINEAKVTVETSLVAISIVCLSVCVYSPAMAVNISSSTRARIRSQARPDKTKKDGIYIRY